MHTLKRATRMPKVRRMAELERNPISAKAQDSGITLAWRSVYTDMYRLCGGHGSSRLVNLCKNVDKTGACLIIAARRNNADQTVAGRTTGKDAREERDVAWRAARSQGARMGPHRKQQYPATPWATGERDAGQRPKRRIACKESRTRFAKRARGAIIFGHDGAVQQRGRVTANRTTKAKRAPRA